MADRDVAILRALRQGPLLLSALAETVDCSIPEVRTSLEELGAAGFEISEHPHLGLRLESVPDRLIADDLMARLENVHLGRRIVVLAETASTNDVAARLARSGAPEGTVVFAERQTAGRGRRGRQWDSPAGEGLWFSLILRPEPEAQSWMRFTTWAAVAVAEALETLCGQPVQIKWPNDVLIDGKKVTGILLEASGPSPGFLIAGMGVNVNQTTFPEGMHWPPGSLRSVTGRIHDRPEVAVAILRSLDASYPTAQSNPEALAASAWARSLFRDAEIELLGHPQPLIGTVAGLDPDGALLLRTLDGEVRTISSGEISAQLSRRSGV